MKYALYAIFALAVSASAATAQMSREQATAEYINTLSQHIDDWQPVDSSLWIEGMSGILDPGDLTPNYVIIDGDIQIPIEQFEALRAGALPRAVFGNVNYWDSIVPFDFAANVNDANQQAAINAMNAISAVAGVVFVLRTSESDWIRFQDSGGNNSPVGRQGDMQIINIFNWNVQIVIVHEIYHSLGFWHQQSASDRDDFVTINDANICGSSDVTDDPCNADVCQGCCDNSGHCVSCAYNFDIESGVATWGPYDFDSFMHYERTAFSCNGQNTIIVDEPFTDPWQNLIGQLNHFSLIDKLSCRGIYPFGGDRWLRAGAGGLIHYGTFFYPFIGTFTAAYDATPVNGTLLIDPGSYSGLGVYSEAKTIRGTYGTIIIGN